MSELAQFMLSRIQNGTSNYSLYVNALKQATDRYIDLDVEYPTAKDYAKSNADTAGKALLILVSALLLPFFVTILLIETGVFVPVGEFSSTDGLLFTSSVVLSVVVGIAYVLFKTVYKDPYRPFKLFTEASSAEHDQYEYALIAFTEQYYHPSQ